MARKVGGITAELLLRDKDFRAKLHRAGRLTESTTARMRRGFNVAAKAMVAAGAVAGGILVAGISRAMGSMDEMAKRADRLRVVPEVLAGMQHWARLSGVEIGQLESAMQRLNKSIGDAGGGRGEARSVFEKLAIDTAELKKLSPDKQMDKIAAALRKVENANERAYMAQEIFGRGAGPVISAMINSGMSFQDAATEAERYGIAVSRIDLAKVEMANDAFTRLRTIGTGLWQQIAIAASGPLTEIATRILNASEDMGGMGEVSERVMNGLVKGGGLVADVFWGWQMAINAVTEAMLRQFSMYSRIVRVTQNKGAELLEKADAAGVESGLRSQALKELVDEGIIKKRFFRREKTRPEIEHSLIDQRKEQIRERGEHRPPMKFEGKIVDDFTKELENLLGQDIERLARERADMTAQGPPSTRLEDFFNESTKKWDEHADAIAKSRANMQHFDDTVDDVYNGMGTLRTAAEAAAMSLADIAAHGKGAQGSLARRATALQEQARDAEASGRFDAAERYRERAGELQGQIDLRQKGYTAEEIRSGEAAAAEAAQLDVETPSGRGGVDTGSQVAGDRSKSETVSPLMEIRDMLRAMTTQLAIANTG